MTAFLRYGILCLVWVVSVSATLGKSVELTPEEQAWINAHPEWRAVGSSSPPQQWIDKSGKYRGIAADFDHLIAKKLGMEVRAVYADSWPASIEQLERREIDACTLLIPTPQREVYLNFTKPVTTFPTAVLVRNDNQTIRSMADLTGKTVAVPRSWAIELNLRQDYPDLDLRSYTTLDEAVLAVATGQVDAYAGDIASTTYALDELGITNLKVAFMLPYTLSLSIGVRKDWPEFIPILNKAIDSITESEYDRIRQRWMAIHHDGLSLWEVLRVVLPTAGILTFVGLLAYVVSLRREIKLRQAAQQEVLDTQNTTIVALAALAETRDTDTGAHLHRTQRYVKAIALELRRQGKHSQLLTDEQIELYHNAAPLHDVGKVGIPDAVLHKPGKLTAEELAIMQTHTTLGHKALSCHDADCTRHTHFLDVAAEIALTHHERWDGKGYPQGLQGEAIPLGGRIMSIADVYDALLSKRCYKEAIAHEEVVRIIAMERGKQFDPDVVDAFLAIEQELLQISRNFADPPEKLA